MALLASVETVIIIVAYLLPVVRLLAVEAARKGGFPLEDEDAFLVALGLLGVESPLFLASGVVSCCCESRLFSPNESVKTPPA